MLNYRKVAASRPSADPFIEQFLMKATDLNEQVNRIGPYFENKRVFFLGDDDHISPLLAERFRVDPVVYEYDERIRKNLGYWFMRANITSFKVEEYDARKPVVINEPCDSFYINPPYSSKSEGLGIKVWLMRALEACQPDCKGILVMPLGNANISKGWTKDVEHSVKGFLGENGLAITNIDMNISSYEHTNDTTLKSSNLYLLRSDPSQQTFINPADLYN